jgi:histidinol-phosphate aminotransferase
MSTTFDWSAWIPARLREGKPYTPGEQKNTRDWIKLNTNEFPFPPSPEVPRAIHAACDDLRLYPDPTGRMLRETLGSWHGVDPASIVLFNGCDDALNCCIRGLVDPGQNVGFLNPSYSLYGVLLQHHGAGQIPVEYLPGFEFPSEGLASCEAKMLLITSPNAPSGCALPRQAVADLLGLRRHVVVLDETYADYSDWSAVSWVQEHPNLIVTRTFSKTFGLAGLRIGYAIACPEVVNVLHQIRDVYNVDRLAQAGAAAALGDREYYAQKHALMAECRNELVEFLTQDLGWGCYPSSTNFVFTLPRHSSGAQGPGVAQKLYTFLVEAKVLVRYFPNHALTSSGLRISIGTPSEMATVRNLLATWNQNAW